MKASEFKGDYGNVMYVVKCNSDRGAKRELTVGKEYRGIYFRETNSLFVTNDYGGQCQIGVHRFDLLKKIDMRTGEELTIKETV